MPISAFPEVVDDPCGQLLGGTTRGGSYTGVKTLERVMRCNEAGGPRGAVVSVGALPPGEVACAFNFAKPVGDLGLDQNTGVGEYRRPGSGFLEG